MQARKSFFTKIFLLLLAVALTVSIYFFSAELQRRYRVEKEISGINRQITSLENSNKQLSDLIEYLRSAGFQEKEIRRKLNLQKPGEHAVALLDGEEGKVPDAGSPGPATGRANWKLWWDYFFGNN